jgi:hypothetical protein
MARHRPLRGRAGQGNEPRWGPLGSLVGYALVGWFMWMFEVELDDGSRLDAYKHVTTRCYLHVCEDGRVFGYMTGGCYRQLDVATALEAVFASWECASPARTSSRRCASRPTVHARRRHDRLDVPAGTAERLVRVSDVLVAWAAAARTAVITVPNPHFPPDDDALALAAATRARGRRHHAGAGAAGRSTWSVSLGGLRLRSAIPGRGAPHLPDRQCPPGTRYGTSGVRSTAIRPGQSRPTI